MKVVKFGNRVKVQFDCGEHLEFPYSERPQYFIEVSIGYGPLYYREGSHEFNQWKSQGKLFVLTGEKVEEAPKC